MMENIVHLKGKASDLLIQTTPAVEILYWAKKLPISMQLLFRPLNVLYPMVV